MTQQSTCWTRTRGNRQFRERRSGTPDATRKARGGGRTKRNKHNNQPVGQSNNTHIWAEGVGGGSRGSRRGRRRGTRGMGGAATTTTRRRGAPRAPPPPFPRGRRWKSPGLFLSSRGEVRMEPGPGGRAGGEGGEWGEGGGGNRDTDDEEETPRGPSSPFPRRRRPPVSLGGDVGPESISACTNN